MPYIRGLVVCKFQLLAINVLLWNSWVNHYILILSESIVYFLEWPLYPSIGPYYQLLWRWKLPRYQFNKESLLQKLYFSLGKLVYIYTNLYILLISSPQNFSHAPTVLSGHVKKFWWWIMYLKLLKKKKLFLQILCRLSETDSTSSIHWWYLMIKLIDNAT